MSEKKKEKDVPIVMVDGIPCINLDQPAFQRKVQQFFPFTKIQNEKQQHFAKVLEEIKGRIPIGHSNVPFNIFIIDVIEFKIKQENEDDCESE